MTQSRQLKPQFLVKNSFHTAQSAKIYPATQGFMKIHLILFHSTSINDRIEQHLRSQNWSHKLYLNDAISLRGHSHSA